MQQGAGKGQPLQVAEGERAGPPAGVGPSASRSMIWSTGSTVVHAGELPGNVEVLDDRQLRVGGGGLDEMSQRGAKGRSPRAQRDRRTVRCAPPSALIIPSSIRMVVDLPAPLRPRKA